MLTPAGLRVLRRAGLLAPTRPDRLLGMGLALARWGVTPATGYAAGAARHPHRPAIVDDDGELSFREVDRRTDRIAAELRSRGVLEGDAVGLLARNGRGFVETGVALVKCGADVLYLSTGTAPGPLRQVLHREQVGLCVHDEDLAELVPRGVTTEELEALAGTSGDAPPRPRHISRQVILTSGTTGAPKGAARAGATLADAVAALSRLPLRAGGTTVLASPVFHAWGLGHLSLAMLLGSTVVLSRRFDPAQVLTSIEQHRATALVVVPVMLEKLLAARPERYDLSCLRMIASSGSALPGDLVARTTAAFGPVLHNLYGSTEVAYAAVAAPADLARDPRTAGRPPHGVRLRVVDTAGRDVSPGATGRIFVGSGLAFDGYTDGSDKDRLDGLVATGDLGALSADGMLTVLGRIDDMVVVGGENVFTGQVEDVLLSHDAVLDAAVVDEPDPAYGVRRTAGRPRRARPAGARRAAAGLGARPARAARGSARGARAPRARAQRDRQAGQARPAQLRVTAPAELDEPRVDEDVDVDRPWVAIVWNDPVNLMSYVTHVLMELFGYSRAKATELMLDVHHKGRAVVSSGTREQIESDVARCHGRGLWATLQQD